MTKKKTHKTGGKPVVYGVGENRTASDSHVLERPIQGKESDEFVIRLNEVISAEESVSAFARKCIINGVSIKEGTIRNIQAGAWPRTDTLIALSEASGVTIDWLATGRLPKYRAELREPSPDPLNPEKLRLALILAEESARVHPLSTEQRADMVLAFYHRLTKGNAP